MTYWGTASIALEFIDEDNIVLFNESDQRLIKRSLDKISQIKKSNLDAGIPNNSQTVNSLYQGLLPSFEEEFTEQDIEKDQVFKSITFTSFRVSTLDWIRFSISNVLQIFGISSQVYFLLGVIPVINSPFSTIFYSPVVLPIFLILMVQTFKVIKVGTLNPIFLIFPGIFFLEIIACSTFGVPLSRYVRLTESFLVIFIVILISTILHKNDKRVK
jgi:hypothetical protein